MNPDQKSLETVFLIVICRQSGDKWQSKTLFLTIFFLYLLIVISINVFDCPLSGVLIITICVLGKLVCFLFSDDIFS